MSLNYSNFTGQQIAFPGYGIQPLSLFPSSVRLRDMGTITSYGYGWGKGIASTNQGWGQSDTSNYYGNDTNLSTTSYDITFKKDIETNVYKYIIQSTNSNISFNSETNNIREITQPINDSQLNLWNSAHTSLTGKKITDINFLTMVPSFTSATGQTSTMTISNFRINDTAVTIENNQSLALTSNNAVRVSYSLYIPIQQITGDFNFKFDLTLPQRSLISSSQEGSRIIFQFGQAIPLTITTTSLSYGYASSNYNQTLSGIGGLNGSIDYAWSITSGTLPSGLSLNSTTGTISGIPNGPAGASTFTVTLTDTSTDNTTTKVLSIVICDALEIGTLSPLDDGNFNSNYYINLDESGGLVPYTWSIIDGALPTGLTIEPSTGEISGIPTGVGIFNFEAQLMDQNNVSVTREYTLTINAFVPGYPTFTSAIIGDSQYTLFWGPPESDGGSTILKYYLETLTEQGNFISEDDIGLSNPLFETS